MLNIPDTEEDHPCKSFTCRCSLKGTCYDKINVLQLHKKRATSFKKFKEKNLDIFLQDDVRPRTYSMPTRSTIKKPEPSNFQRAYLRLGKDIDNDTYNVRAFEVSSKGVITKRSDSIRSRSTNSIYSSEGDLENSSLQCLASSSVSKENIRESYDILSIPVIPPTRVVVLGNPGVGKTGLTQQFMTLEYLGGFNTSVDGETERTVNVLLDGEETSLVFVDETEHDVMDDVSGNIAAYLIVYACDDRVSFDRAVDTVCTLRQKQLKDDIIFFVGNKSDLVRSKCVTTDEAKAVAKNYDCKFVETSVVLNVNIDELLVGIVKQLRFRITKDEADKSTGCAPISKSLLNKIFKKHKLSKSCDNLYS